MLRGRENVPEGEEIVRRPLEEQVPLVGEPGSVRRAFRDDPGRWLPPPARWQGRGRWNVRLQAGPLSRVVTCQVGTCWHVGAERWRLLGWEPVDQPGDAVPVERGLPWFRGELGVVEEDRETALLVLRGTYTPPAGPLGAVADAAGLRLVAARTGQTFLQAVSAQLASLAREAPGGEPAG